MQSTSFSNPGYTTSDKPLINLLRGWPNQSLLPIAQIKEAANAALDDTSVAVPGMLYGPDNGDLRLRSAISKWLAEFYNVEPDVERICITGGASQNLACVLSTFTDPAYTRAVWIIAPAYMMAFRIFDDAGFHAKFRAVPEDDEGLDIDFLRKGLENDKIEHGKGAGDGPTYKVDRPWSKFYKHIIYAVPTFTNPSSKTMSLRRRQELVRVAREYDALIITDDVYDQLSWRSDTDLDGISASMKRSNLPRLIDIDQGMKPIPNAESFGNVLSNGSFSKICGPGTRTGWVEASPRLAYGVSQTGSSKSGGAPSQLVATFLAKMLEKGTLQDHVLNVLQPAYARRWKKMIKALETHLVPLGARLPQTDRDVVGGYFIWVHLPPSIDAVKLAKRTQLDENLVIAAGQIFEVPSQEHTCSFPNDIRLCFAWEDEEKLEEGVERLTGVVKAMLAEGDGAEREKGVETVISPLNQNGGVQYH